MSGDILSFRDAKPSDATSIAAIHDAAWRNTYQGIIPHLHLERMIARRGPVWWRRQIDRGSNIELLIFDGVPQGYVSFGRARGAWPWAAGEIFELYIAPAHQGVGLGGKLFVHAYRTLKSEGYNKLVVWALQDNELACSFYGGLGGAVAATAEEKYGDVSLTRVAFAWGVKVKPSKA